MVNGGTYRSMGAPRFPLQYSTKPALQSTSYMFSYILSLMRGMNQGAGYQKVAKVKTQDVVIALVKMSTCCGFRKAAQLQWVAKWQSALCKDYYETRKNVNLYIDIYKINL